MIPPRAPSAEDLARALGLPPATSLLPPLDVLIATASLLTLARYGVPAKLTTHDALTWACVCADPETGVTLADLPVGTGGSPWRAVERLLEVLHEMNLRDALGPEEEGDPRFDVEPELPDAPGLVRCEPAADAAATEVA